MAKIPYLEVVADPDVVREQQPARDRPVLESLGEISRRRGRSARHRALGELVAVLVGRRREPCPPDRSALLRKHRGACRRELAIPSECTRQSASNNVHGRKVEYTIQRVWGGLEMSNAWEMVPQ